MEIAIDSWLGIGLAAGVFVAGAVLGVLAARLAGGEGRRARRLQEELRAARAEQEAYRRSVAQHFQQTSDIFRDLTGVYTSLYTHLAEGARSLCAESVPALRFEAPARLGERTADGSARVERADAWPGSESGERGREGVGEHGGEAAAGAPSGAAARSE